MKDHSSRPLDRAVRQAAEAFFRTDLSEVVVHRGDWRNEFGASAFAFGNQIYMPAAPSISSVPELELLGHELAHIVQQQQGRVQKTCMLAGLPANDDPALEHEAIRAGWNFAHGMKSDWPDRPASATSSSVIQRAVIVAGKHLQSVSELGRSEGIVLQLIEQGESWLKWAIGTGSEHYTYPDQSALLVDAQRGLHDSDLMLLPTLGLLVHPLKLLGMQTDDLTALAAAESGIGDSIAQTKCQRALARYQLRSQTELSFVAEFLASVGLTAEPVFQALTISDQLALFDLANGASSENHLNPMLQREAARFAVQHANSPHEFADYYHFFFASLDEGGPRPVRAAARNLRANVLLESLQPLLFGKLSCPAVAATPSPDEMNIFIRNWLLSGKAIGVARPSLGAAQIAQFVHGSKDNRTAYPEIIKDYFTRANSLLSEGRIAMMKISQDGREHSYRYEHGGSSAEVSLTSDGQIALKSYHPKPLAE